MGRLFTTECTYLPTFVQFFQRFRASHELEGIMAGVVSTDIAHQGAFLNQDSRSMIDQRYEDMLTGKSSKLSRSQCLPLGRKEVRKARLLPDGRVPQTRLTGRLEGLGVMSTSSPWILLN